MPFFVARTLVWSSLWLDVAASGSLPRCRGNLARAGGKIHDVSERIDFQEIGGCVIESSPVSFRKLSFVFFPSGGLKAYHIFLLCALYPLLSTAVKYVCWPMKRSARRPLCHRSTGDGDAAPQVDAVIAVQPSAGVTDDGTHGAGQRRRQHLQHRDVEAAPATRRRHLRADEPGADHDDARPGLQT